jgi:hypothetical protein
MYQARKKLSERLLLSLSHTIYLFFITTTKLEMKIEFLPFAYVQD